MCNRTEKDAYKEQQIKLTVFFLLFITYRHWAFMIIRVTRTFGSFPISAVVNYYKSVTQKHKFFQRNHAYPLER